MWDDKGQTRKDKTSAHYTITFPLRFRAKPHFKLSLRKRSSRRGSRSLLITLKKKTLSVPFHQHEFVNRQGSREDLCSVLSGSRSLRCGEMRPSRLLPLLDKNESSLRPEVLRRLPRGARQGGLPLSRWLAGSLAMLARPRHS